MIIRPIGAFAVQEDYKTPIIDKFIEGDMVEISVKTNDDMECKTAKGRIYSICYLEHYGCFKIVLDVSPLCPKSDLPAREAPRPKNLQVFFDPQLVDIIKIEKIPD